MFGSITKFKPELGVGVIVSEDGQKFRFKRDEIVNPNGRVVGYEVDFEVSRGAGPKDIILMTGSPWDVFVPGDQKNQSANS